MSDLRLKKRLQERAQERENLNLEAEKPLREREYLIQNMQRFLDIKKKSEEKRDLEETQKEGTGRFEDILKESRKKRGVYGPAY